MKKPKVSVNERSFYYCSEAAIMPLSDLTSVDNAGNLVYRLYEEHHR